MDEQNKKYSERQQRKFFSVERPYVPTKIDKNDPWFKKQLKYVHEQQEKNKELKNIPKSILDLVINI